jgi:hypothetical protein
MQNYTTVWTDQWLNCGRYEFISAPGSSPGGPTISHIIHSVMAPRAGDSSPRI